MYSPLRVHFLHRFLELESAKTALATMNGFELAGRNRELLCFITTLLG